MTGLRSGLMCVMAVAGAAGVVRADASPSDPFTFVVNPDTQIQSVYSTWGESWLDSTQWVRDNVDEKNIKFFTHVGDLVQGEFGGVENLPGSTWANQWRRADAIMSQLDLINTIDNRSLPYSASIGNHDLLNRGNKANPEDTFDNGGFRTFFGENRYSGYNWYGGTDETQWNHYQIIDTGEYEYLHINLEYKPEDATDDLGLGRVPGVDDAINWAQSIIEKHSDYPTILSSHQLLTDLDGENDKVGYIGDGADETFGEGERMSSGREVWERLVRSNEQIFMTLNGHEHEGAYREDGEYHQVSTNDKGLPVFEILVNYQDYANPLTGSDPYLRLLEFDAANGEIRNETFSPTFAMFNDDPDTVEARLDAILELYDAGLPIPIFAGEDLADIIATSPFLPGDAAETREEAEAKLLAYFGVTDREGLRNLEFSEYLTDRDSEFTFSNLTFNAEGRPVPEPSTLLIMGLGGVALLTRRRRA